MKYTIATITIAAAALAFSPAEAVAEGELITEAGTSAGKLKRKAPPASRAEAISRTQNRLGKLESMSDEEWKQQSEKRQQKRSLRKERRQQRQGATSQ